MSEKNGRAALSWTHVAVAALVAATLLAVVWILAGAGGPFTIALDKEGKVTIEAEAGDNFADILRQAIAEDPDQVASDLAGQDYYSVHSIRLVDALGKLGADPEPSAVTLGIRKLLWNLDGPFQGPGTLASADERFIRALEEIDRPVLEPGDKSRLIIELWQRGLERESPLGVRTFRASVVPVRALPDASAPLVFVCPGTGLASKAVTISNSHGGAIIGVLEEDSRRLPCADVRVAIDRLFAGESLTLGVAPALYQALADPQNSGATLPPEVEAFFEVQPAKLTALVTKPD